MGGEETAVAGESPATGPRGTPSQAHRSWNRVVAMVTLKPGISEEIASDPESTKQGLFVAGIATGVALLATLPFMVLTIPLAIVGIAATAGVCSLVSRLSSESVPPYAPYAHWLRVFLYASAPGVLGIVPFAGTIAGAIYSTVLVIVAVRDLARVSTGTAIVAWLVSIGVCLAASVTVVLLASAAAILGLVNLFG